MDYLLVLDFEATCDETEDAMSRVEKDAQREIIEFPIVKLNAKTGVIEGEFHAFVKPQDGAANGCRKLSDFCRNLTGIQQAQVESAQPLAQVLQQVDAWLKDQQLDKNFCFVTCGDWDLRDMLPTEGKRKGIVLQPYWSQYFINVKDVFYQCMGSKPDMSGMLRELGLPLQGHLHSGRDDARNIAQICAALLRKGAEFVVKARAGPTRRPGDWDCPTCGKLIFASKGSCFVCDNERAGDWTCPRCQAKVFGSKASCFKCGTPNPAPAPVPNRAQARNGDWACPNCQAIVFASKRACYKCGKQRQ